jgi:DNA mismatch repair protein MutS2
VNPSLLDAAATLALDAEWLSAALSPASEYGMRSFAELRPFVAGEETAAQQRAVRIAEYAGALELERLDALRAALGALPDSAATFARAAMGDVLDDAAFFEMQRFCDGAAHIDTLLGDAVDAAPACNSGVRAVGDALEPGRVAGSGFYLADPFDAGLGSVRSDLRSAQAHFDAVRGRALAAVAAALAREDVAGEEFIVMRSDVTGELPPGVRVLREAPTYFLCAVELDGASLAAMERREEAAAAVASAEEATRVRLSHAVAASAPALRASAEALGELDVLVAAARFTRAHSCHVARIVAEPLLAFEGGRFLPLALELAAEGRAFAPIDIELRGVAVLTGPNMGGKSVCLRTCGFVALCAAFGLPVPADRAECGIFDEIAWLGVGAREERLGGLLSTFAREVVRLRDVLARGSRRLLVLADEFARTTTPPEGKALLVALLRRLRARGACALAATHLSGIASAAGARHFAVRGLRGIPQAPAVGDLHQALAVLAASMDYTIGEVGDDDASSADALALASLLGLDAEIVADARRLLGSARDGRVE